MDMLEISKCEYYYSILRLFIKKVIMNIKCYFGIFLESRNREPFSELKFRKKEASDFFFFWVDLAFLGLQ